MRAHEALALDEAALIAAAGRPWDAGGSEAFWELWIRREAWIGRRVRSRGRLTPQGCAREVFCDAVLEAVRDKMQRNIGQYRGEGSFEGFLTRLIDRAAIDEWRRRRRMPEVSTTTAAGSSGPSSEEVMEALYHRVFRSRLAPSPHDVAEARERRTRIHLALRLMALRSAASANWAAVLRRRFFDEMPFETIAMDMGVTERTVFRWLDKGLRELERTLKARFRVGSLRDI